MPSKLRAGGVFPFTFEEDRDGTLHQFMLNVLSAEQADILSDIRTSFLAATDGKERARLESEALAITVNRCLIEGCTVEGLRGVLTHTECWGLINAAQEASTLSASEKKKFVLPLLSETDKSADDAVPSV